MEEIQLQTLKYPIGKFKAQTDVSETDIESWIADVRNFPLALEEALSRVGVNAERWSYRPQGWTIRQVVHHLADSHINGMNRFKWTLTEEAPKLMGYKEDFWVDLPDVQSTPLDVSLNVLKGIHVRWANLMSGMKRTDFDREFHHLDAGVNYSLLHYLQLYAWHGKHHLAHIEQALEHLGEFNTLPV